jgi:hypothetical protein
VSLVARYLERNGIPTVVMGAAKDIVEWAGVPRFLFSDFPLGNSAGKPHEPDTQRFTLETALKVLESAVGPRTTVQSPLRWSADADWKVDYCNVQRLSPEELQRRRSAFDASKAQAKQLRDEGAQRRPAADGSTR